jgi:hypothetical protein
MLEKIALISNKDSKGRVLTARFAPGCGMNMISLKRDEIQIIDQSTLPLFEERFAGLGAMIGPHFYHRKIIPAVKNPSLFPHIAGLQKKGVAEPFSHGIGRYAPWKVEEATETKIAATLEGKELWNGVALAELEGQDFTMRYEAQMLETGLEVTLSVSSQRPSVIGLHTYYKMEEGAKVKAQVQPYYYDQGVKKERTGHELAWDLKDPIDFGFAPYPDPLHGDILLDNPTLPKVKVDYECQNEENSFQVWHLAGGSFVCIEPLSAKNPQEPTSSVVRLKILISII